MLVLLPIRPWQAKAHAQKHDSGHCPRLGEVLHVSILVWSLQLIDCTTSQTRQSLATLFTHLAAVSMRISTIDDAQPGQRKSTARMLIGFCRPGQPLPIFANKEVVVPKTSRPVMLNPVLSPDIAQFVISDQCGCLQYGRLSMSRPQSCAHETLKDVLVQTCWQALGRSGWPIDGQSWASTTANLIRLRSGAVAPQYICT